MVERIESQSDTNSTYEQMPVVSDEGFRVPLSRPDITDLERRYVMQVLETPYLSIGPHLSKFESQLAAYAGVKHAIAVNSGTSALHLIIKALGISAGYYNAV
jgi:dTDP-4-amino-4,6-dideoxygalactose transaminase